MGIGGECAIVNRKKRKLAVQSAKRQFDEPGASLYSSN